MIFRKGGKLANNVQFKYGNNKLEIVNRFLNINGFVYKMQKSPKQTLIGQAQKDIFYMKNVFKIVCVIKT